MLAKEGRSSRDSDSFPGDSFDSGSDICGERQAGGKRIHVCLDLDEAADEHCSSADENDACSARKPQRINARSNLPTVSTWSFGDDNDDEPPNPLFLASEDCMEGKKDQVPQKPHCRSAACRLKDLVLRRRANQPAQLASPAPAPPSPPAPDTPSLRKLVGRPRSKTPKGDTSGRCEATPSVSGMQLGEVGCQLNGISP